MAMRQQKMKPVHRPCGHTILVPKYQPSDPEAYTSPCQKCAVGEAERAKGWKKGRDSK